MIDGNNFTRNLERGKLWGNLEDAVLLLMEAKSDDFGCNVYWCSLVVLSNNDLTLEFLYACEYGGLMALLALSKTRTGDGD